MLTRTLLLVVGAVALLPASDLAGVKVESDPFILQTDVGSSAAEEHKTAERFLRPITETANFFLKVYDLKGSCFDDYAMFYDHPTSHFEKTIRIRIWRTYDDFLADFQKRYQTKSLPGAFFGISELTDDYGKATGTHIREIGVACEGMDDMAVLRDLYHEMGHLFMRTFIVRQVEVPSWIEEGTAELFELRLGNGTKPEGERDQREGWLTEMVAEGTTIPWKDMINVHNLDNLDFTYQDPIRSQIQYVQAWSMIEFMVSNDLRQSAFIDMLRRFKQQAENRAVEISGQAHSPEEFNRLLQPYLYSIQEDTFQKCYGNSFLEVEAVWKQWIKRQYQNDLKKKPILHYYRGDWYLLRARYPRKGETTKSLRDKASAIFEDCITTNPDKPEGYVGRGRVLLSIGDIAAAGEAFSKALALGANNYDALLYGGIARVLSGHCKDAIDPLTKAALQRPTDAQVQRYLGQALAAGGGDLKLAVLHLRSARDLEPKEAPMCAFLEGAAHYQAGHLHDAFLAWLRVENLNATFPMIQIYQALAKAEDNDRDTAVALLKPLEGTEAGKAFITTLADPKRPIPKVSFTADGWPTIDWAAAGLHVTQAATAEAQPANGPDPAALMNDDGGDGKDAPTPKSEKTPAKD